MTFSCKKRDHNVTVELPARTLQVLFCCCQPASMLLSAQSRQYDLGFNPCLAAGSSESEPPVFTHELVHGIGKGVP